LIAFQLLTHTVLDFVFNRIRQQQHHVDVLFLDYDRVKQLKGEFTTVYPKELAQPNRIRVETAVSRFPIHCLSRKGEVTIDLQRFNDAGVADFKWEVTYNSKHGQPGPLAYKVDTLVINRILDQMGRPLPELVRIGSLSEVCRFLGTQDTGPNITNLKSAFLQNASTFINAKIRYKTKNGREKWTEMGYTRYSVVFTGEALPDGTQADAVHLVLNPPYRELLNHAETRPLDYDYLKKLPPGPQRFYELLSFQIYGAIAGARARAKMLYSDYCKYAPQVRYGDFNHVKKQMYKLHVTHRESGYITKIDYQSTIDQEGNPDWEMLYTPGPKAFAEYQAFTNRHLPQLRASELTLPKPKQGRPIQATLALTCLEPNLFRELTNRGISEAKASELLDGLKPAQVVRDQLEYVDSLVAKDKKGKIENPPGLYIYYIRDNIVPPSSFCSSRKSRLQDEAQQLKNTELARRARLEIAYDEYRNAEINRFAESLPADEYRQIFEASHRKNRSDFKLMTDQQMEDLTHGTVRAELERSGRVQLLSPEDFIIGNSSV
jgi:hypothetical protein